MFIAMNRFRVARGSEDAFETLWLNRESHLGGVPGFVAFKLLRGPTAEDHTLYASHSSWESRAAFEAWTNSDAFRAAHSQARSGPSVAYLGPPQLETFETLQALP